MIKPIIPYIVLIMSTAYVYFANILYMEWLKSVKIVSFVPKLANGKACPPRPAGGEVENSGGCISYYAVKRINLSQIVFSFIK